VFRFVLLAALLAALCAVTVSPAAQVAERSDAVSCQPFQTLTGPLGMETVVKAESITCEKATRILKKHDDSVDRDVAFSEGGKFQLGNYRCGVRKVFTESARARCGNGDRMFRIDYGS
jgi:hypothetical protein